MTTSKDVTPAKFRCLASLQCPSIHISAGGDYIFINTHVSDGELKTMGIVDKDDKPKRSAGEGAIRISPEFVKQFVLEYISKHFINEVIDEKKPK